MTCCTLGIAPQAMGKSGGGVTETSGVGGRLRALRLPSAPGLFFVRGLFFEPGLSFALDMFRPRDRSGMPHAAPCASASWMWRVLLMGCVVFGFVTQVAAQVPPPAPLKLPEQWEYSAPVLRPELRDVEPSRAQKDPTFVRQGGHWHLFTTSKLPGRSAIEYCRFADWSSANAAPRTLLTVSNSDYFCAPQVFYFRPHQKWYLIYQMGVPGASKMWVAYSTTTNIADPTSWTKARPVLDGGPEDGRTVGGLDYWVICDDQKAYLFFTSLNGRMWRMWTEIDRFPHGFRDCQLALRGPVFEASHTYRLQGREEYLTIIEQSGQRHYKAYLARSLDGPWQPLRDSQARPFAGASNVRPRAGVAAWADNISHGELVRTSHDERLIVDPDNLQFVFQGMLQRDKQRKGYGEFNWKLGVLTPR